MKSRLVSAAVLVVMLVPLLLVGFWGTRVDAAFHDDIVVFADWLAARGFDFVNYSFVDFVANMAWFAPFAALAVLVLGRRSWPVVLLAGVTLSVGIELGQAYLLPERVGTPLDVFANTIGTIFGVAVGVMAASLLGLRRRVRVQTA
jgi:glycopeptide antibiotics resistance protein